MTATRPAVDPHAPGAAHAPGVREVSAAPPRRSGRRPLRTYGPPAVVVVVLVAAWQVGVSLSGVAATILPGPWRVASATWDDRVDLWPAITTTTVETVLGLLLAIGVAAVVGLGVDASRTVRRSLYPIVVASQTLPIVALAPLVVIWWGFGLLPKVVLVALFSFFPIVVGLVSGLASADQEAVDLLRTMGAGRAQVLARVRLPGALAQVFTGLRISVTYAFTSAIVAEFVGATQGLGYYMTNAAHAAPVRTDLVFGATVVTAALTVALFVVVGVLQRLATPWRPRSRA